MGIKIQASENLSFSSPFFKIFTGLILHPLAASWNLCLTLCAKCPYEHSIFLEIVIEVLTIGDKLTLILNDPS